MHRSALASTLFAALVSLQCHQWETTDPYGNVLVEIKLTNAGTIAVSRANIAFFNVGFLGEQIGQASHVTIAVKVPAGKTLTRNDSVKAPPDFGKSRFDSLDCRLESVTFADGSKWP